MDETEKKNKKNNDAKSKQTSKKNLNSDTDNNKAESNVPKEGIKNDNQDPTTLNKATTGSKTSLINVNEDNSSKSNNLNKEADANQQQDNTKIETSNKLTKVTIEKVDYPLKKRKEKKMNTFKEDDKELVEKTLDKSHVQPVRSNFATSVAIPKVHLEENETNQVIKEEEQKHPLETLGSEGSEKPTKVTQEEIDNKKYVVTII